MVRAFFAVFDDGARRGAAPDADAPFRGAARFLGAGGAESSAMMVSLERRMRAQGACPPVVPD